jgi:hypothetical protein
MTGDQTAQADQQERKNCRRDRKIMQPRIVLALAILVHVRGKKTAAFT